MTPQSIYRLRTEGQNQASQYIPRRSLRSLGGYNQRKTDRRRNLMHMLQDIVTIQDYMTLMKAVFGHVTWEDIA